MEAQQERNSAITDEIANRRRHLFALYVEPYLNMIRSLTYRYTFNKSNAEDNYSEVLTNMYKYIETYDPKRSIRTWLHIVTKRCVYDLDTRKQKNNKFNRDQDISDSSTDLIDNDEISGNVMGVDNYRELYSDDVLEALDKLKPIHRDALILQQAGYNLNEITDIEYKKGSLKTRNIETVKSRLFLARQALQKLLTRDGNRKEN